MDKLTEPQQIIIAFLREHHRRGNPVPSIREVTDHCRYKSTKATRDHLDALERGGWISRNSRKARSIRVLGGTMDSVPPLDEVPVLGTIPAGATEDHSEYVEGYIRMDLGSLGMQQSSGVFALKVRGDSMTGRGIYDGDTAIVDGNAEPDTGDVVVALIDNEATLKTLVRQGEKTFLKAENPLYSDLYPRLSLDIQGVVKTIIRLNP